MRQEVTKRNSIYLRLLRLLLISAVISGVFFVLTYGLGEVIKTYYFNANYVEQKNNEYAVKLQKYVRKNQVSAKDSRRLTEWVDKQEIISIQIYKNNILTYNSDYPGAEAIWEQSIEASYNGLETYYQIEFSDGMAEVAIYGLYSYQFQSYFMIVELMLAFVLFLIIVMLGIRRTIEYIRLLCSEIEILEGGNLEYVITVSGNDELGALAKGLDDMRKTFRDQVEHEAYLMQANQKMITDMSHDLRTPLTSIMIYTEILKKGKYKDEQQMQEYIGKIEQKTRLMKQLSNRIFEYSLVTSEVKVSLSEPLLFKSVFYDLLSETCTYLEQRGCRMELDFKWEERMVQINPDYLMRIFDNITSNIVKYADVSSPVKVCSVYTEKESGFSFENVCRNLEKKEDSTEIGLRNIKNMMDTMNGNCEIKNEGNSFKITLVFPNR